MPKLSEVNKGRYIKVGKGMFKNARGTELRTHKVFIFKMLQKGRSSTNK